MLITFFKKNSVLKLGFLYFLNFKKCYFILTMYFVIKFASVELMIEYIELFNKYIEQFN